jgi:peptide chain release factor 1
MSLDSKFATIVKKHKELSDKMANPEKIASQDFASVSKEYSDLSQLVEKIESYQAAQIELADCEEMYQDPDLDADMKEEIASEIRDLKPKVESLFKKIQFALLPKDAADEKNAIIEVRAGTGGDEAALFAADLFHMYQRYADKNNWKFEVLSISDTGIGGYKDASANIIGKGVFAKLKFESGVHRVQRVPATETQGRVHTSAATVAILPEAEDIDVKLEEKDLRIDIFRASGPGGQSVNTTDSAVRIVHIPTGIMVSQQDEKSQHKNREKGMKILRSRIYNHQRAEADAVRSADRKGQIGSGDRSERIRTYNYPQGRVSDHRINMTLYRIDAIVKDGDLDDFIQALIAEDQASRLSEEN